MISHLQLPCNYFALFGVINASLNITSASSGRLISTFSGPLFTVNHPRPLNTSSSFASRVQVSFLNERLASSSSQFLHGGVNSPPV